MKFAYRGVNYEDQPSTLEVTEGEIGGMYRGQNWRFRYVRHIPEPLPTPNLKYRGVAYRTSEPTAAIPSRGFQSVADVAARTLSTRNKRELLDEMMSSHQKNIQRSLEHRLQVARANGDHNLIRLLEAESEQMTLSLR
jgi:hypothetical protein